MCLCLRMYKCGCYRYLDCDYISNFLCNLRRDLINSFIQVIRRNINQNEISLAAVQAGNAAIKSIVQRVGSQTSERVNKLQCIGECEL